MQTKFATRNDCYTKNKAQLALSPGQRDWRYQQYYQGPRGIMVHSTGANNPWLSRYTDGPNDWDRPNLEVCVHAFVGKAEDGTVDTCQILPWDYRAWHCGGDANNTHLAFEICEDDLQDRTYFEAAYAEAVRLTAQLCREFGLDPLADGVVIDHAEGYRRGLASNHADVGHWFGRFNKTMDDFRAAVAAEMEEDDMTKTEVQAIVQEALAGRGYKRLEDVPKWARPTAEKLVKSGVLQGDGEGLNLSYDLLRTLVILDRAGKL